MNIDWEGLIVGFESRSHRITHFFDRETGDVEQVLERDDERHAAMSGDSRYLPIPRDHGERTRGDMEEFVSQCEDAECARILAAALRSEDFASKYREALLRHPAEEARFFQFKEHQALQRARSWLEGLGIPYEKPQREM